MNLSSQNSPKLRFCTARALSVKNYSFHARTVDRKCMLAFDIYGGVHGYEEAETEPTYIVGQVNDSQQDMPNQVKARIGLDV